MSGPTEDYRGAYDEATLWMALSSIDPLWTFREGRLITTDPIILAQLRAHWG